MQLVNTFWSGIALTPVEAACLRSFVRRGIHVRFFSYDAVELPAGLEWVDASEVLPRDKLFHFEGSPSAFSNIFRYKLLLEQGGWWVDTDVVLQAGSLPELSHYWAWQDLRRINGAVLRFPKGDPLCASLLAESQSRSGHLPRWGALGPDLLTELIWNSPYQAIAQPVASTYPVHWLQTHYFWFPEFAPAVHRLCAGASFVHLWNSVFPRMGLDLARAVPEGSYLAGLTPLHAAPLDADQRAAAVASARRYLGNDWVRETWQRVMPEGAELRWPT